jgi:hypothetical protein
VKGIHLKRCEKFIKSRIALFNLDLTDLTVYTELGTGNYAFTCIIAAMANAKNITRTLNIQNIRDKIEVVDVKRREHLQEADIVTNSGFVRPIDQNTLSMMKPTAVIPLMYETWEIRKEDIDLDYCRSNDILVLGVNEECPPMDIMRYSGFLVSKLMFECGLGVHKDKILILGSGRLGNNLAHFMGVNGIDFSWISLDDNVRDENRQYLSKIEDVKRDLSKFDAIVVGENYHNVELIGENGTIKTAELSEKSPLIQIIHICGNGPKATVELNTAGLKVGEIMARNRLKYNLNRAYKESIKHPLVDDFSPSIYYKD